MGSYTDRLRRRKKSVPKRTPDFDGEKLVSCAIRREEAIHRGFRSHYDLRRSLGDEEPSRPLPGDEEGFWTSQERFVNREQGNRIASNSGQCPIMRREMLSSDIDW